MRDVRRLAHVKRWAIVPKIKDQSVAEHSYYVSLYTLKMCQILGKSPEFCVSAVQYAMEHDAGEAFTGDIPSPFKDLVIGFDKVENDIRTWMDLNSPITEGVSDIVHLADKLDALLWLLQEHRMGNTTIVRLMDEMMLKVKDRASKLGVSEFTDKLIEETSDPIVWYIG